MIRFDQLLARADDEILQQLVGSSTVRLLNLLDAKLSSASQLRGLVAQLRPPEELLRHPASRGALLDLLGRSEAVELVSMLGLAGEDPYAALRGAKLRRGSQAERTLFHALDVVPAVPPDAAPAPGQREQSAQYSLFGHQRLAARRVQAFLDSTPNRVVLHMPTGAGKTRTAMHLVARELRRREPNLVVWLAFSEELCEQSAEEFESAWDRLGDRPTMVYRYWGSRSLSIDNIGDGLMVVGLAKLFQAAKRGTEFITRLADRTSLVVIDEAHQAIAESYRTVLEILVERNPGTRLLGLTATPGRTWNDPDKDRELAEFFARQKVTLEVEGYDNPVDYLIGEGYLARPTFESLRHTGTELSAADRAQLVEALEIPEQVLEKLAASEQRNLLLVHRIEQLVGQHQRIIVFAATVGHARLITTILNARGINAAAVTAATPPGERSRVIAKFRGAAPEPMVLVNYGVLTTGFDAPRTSAAVIARPTKSLVLYSQMVGRATRGPRAGGNTDALIVTVVDTSLPGFGEMSEAFTNWEDVW